MDELLRRMRIRAKVEQLPCGAWRASREDVVGIGTDRYEAVHALTRKESILFDDIQKHLPEWMQDQIREVSAGFPEIIKSMIEEEGEEGAPA